MISQGEIVEVPFLLPEGGTKFHPAMVISCPGLQDSGEDLIYAVLISTKNHYPQYTLELKKEWLNKPMGKQSYFVTHLVSFFRTKNVRRTNTFVKGEFVDIVISKIIKNIIGWDIE